MQINIKSINIHTSQIVNITKNSQKDIEELRQKIENNVRQSLSKYTDESKVSVHFVYDNDKADTKETGELEQYKGFDIFNTGAILPISVRVWNNPDFWNEHFTEKRFATRIEAKEFIDKNFNNYFTK